MKSKAWKPALGIPLVVIRQGRAAKLIINNASSSSLDDDILYYFASAH
jgi:hypothetical protein